jgi:hypothetical protein
VDLGAVFEGTVLEHDFALEVHHPLSIVEVRSDCGCTASALERVQADGARTPYREGEELSPGTRLLLRTRYDTRGRRGRAPRNLTVVHGAGPALVLTLDVEVQPRLLCEPADLEPLRLLEGETAERSFTVHCAGGERFRLHPSRRALPPAVLVEVEPMDADPSGRATRWRATVRLAPDVPRGTHSYPIELVSDLALPGGVQDVDGRPRCSVVAPPLGVQVLGPVALSTPTVSFGVVGGGETVARSVRVESHDPGFQLPEPRARLEALRPGDPCPLARTASIQVRPVPGRPDYDVELLLAGLDPAVGATFAGRLVVETGHPAAGRLEALVTGQRADSRSREAGR